MKNANEKNVKKKQNANEKNVKKKQNANEKNDKNKQKNKNIKKKKDNTKSAIDSPFNLDFPSIENENFSQIVSCLKESFKDYLCTHKKTMECEENTDMASVKGSKKSIENPLLKAHPACIIFGYNSVMRGLEKENLKIVLVTAFASPDILTKSFIPICNLKSIPLIPVKNLSHTFGNIGIRSTLAVGFTIAACEKEGPFNNLYNICCKALGYDGNKEDLSFSKENSKPKEENSKPKENKKDQLENKKAGINLISSYHLKRKDRKNRVFEPPKREFPCDESFIKLEEGRPLKLSDNFDSKCNKKRKAAKAFKKEPTSDTKATLPKVSELSFYIDVNSDDIDLEEIKKEPSAVDDNKPVKKKRSTARYFEALNTSANSDFKKKAHYIPAKIRRIKANSKKHP